jgi:hypothetical protein
MGWFSRIFGEPGEAPFNSDLPEPEPLDWGKMEAVLFALSERALRDFVAKHPADVFYGFGFDCDSERVQVLLCINSRAELEVSARDSLTSPYAAGRSLSQLMADYEWDIGTWRYQGFNLPSKRWDAQWAEAEAAVSNTLSFYRETRQREVHEKLQVEFMDMCARALLRLQSGEMFQGLHKENEFRIFCADNGESVAEEGVVRMARLMA